jgi:hypothetical protein
MFVIMSAFVRHATSIFDVIRVGVIGFLGAQMISTLFFADNGVCHPNDVVAWFALVMPATVFGPSFTLRLR